MAKGTSFFLEHRECGRKRIVLSPAGNEIFKINNRNSRTKSEIYSKLTIKTPERRPKLTGKHLGLSLFLIKLKA